MNILEQEDLIKGLPDQVLVEEAQAPTGNIPQYLVVSEIQRREKMRSKFDEQVPQNTVTDQIVSGGIAAMNPNPDPLMGMAMGAPPPMTGQDPMMQPPMQDPMMGQMPQDIAMGQQMPQDPMMQMQDPMMQPPMQDPMMQDPMMGQQMMAAGGGMMPYRMGRGSQVPFDFDRGPSMSGIFGTELRRSRRPDAPPLKYNMIDLGGGSAINERGVYPIGRRDDAGNPVLNRMGNQIMYAEGDPEKKTILAALGRDVGAGGGVQEVIDRAVRRGFSQEKIPELLAAVLSMRNPPDMGELKQALEDQGYYVPPLEELVAERSGSQKEGVLSREEDSSIDASILAQSSVKPSIYSTALREDVSRSPTFSFFPQAIAGGKGDGASGREALLASLAGFENTVSGVDQGRAEKFIEDALREPSAKPVLGEAGFLEGFDPELARMIAAPEAGSAKVNPRVAANPLNVLEEMVSPNLQKHRLSPMMMNPMMMQQMGMMNPMMNSMMNPTTS